MHFSWSNVLSGRFVWNQAENPWRWRHASLHCLSKCSKWASEKLLRNEMVGWLHHLDHLVMNKFAMPWRNRWYSWYLWSLMIIYLLEMVIFRSVKLPEDSTEILGSPKIGFFQQSRNKVLFINWNIRGIFNQHYGDIHGSHELQVGQHPMRRVRNPAPVGRWFIPLQSQPSTNGKLESNYWDSYW